MPALHCHGCCVYGAHGKLISSVGVEPRAVRAILDGLPGQTVFLFNEDTVYLVQDDGTEDWIARALKYDRNVIDCRSDPSRTDVLAKVDSGALPIVKVTIGTSPPNSGAMLDRLIALSDDGRLFQATRAVDFIIECCRPGVDKSTALRTLCDSLDIPLSSVLAFGDGDNDAAMLEAAGYGCAMANAMPKALEAARYRTLSNDEGGVGAFLERIYGTP